MNIIDKICAQSELTPEQQKILADWERADGASGSPAWTPEDRAECLQIFQQIPDFRPIAIDLARFGSVDSLFSRYRSVLSDLVREGILTHEDAEKSAAMAISGAISIAGVIREGKALREWLDDEAERRKIAQEFAATRAGKTALAA